MKKVLILLFQFSSLMIINGQNKIVLSNTNIIDGISQSEKRNMMVFISNGKIESIKKNGSKYKVLDFSITLIPFVNIKIKKTIKATEKILAGLNSLFSSKCHDCEVPTF